ncbi:MAG: hypothetical protein U0325_02250 [Polyangiales bacterium]
MSSAPSSPLTEVGSSHAAALLYQGRYLDVLAATVDSPAGTRPEDLAFAVGALAFAGRVVEAELLCRNALRAPEARTRAAAAFFVCVAQCRSGRLDDAVRTLRHGVQRTDRARDAWSRALLLQGAACVRFFSGRLAPALADAVAAQASALAAGFAYASMLANDLRGHTLAAVGSVPEGVEVLALARDQAARLGYDENARVIATSIALHRASVAEPAEALAILSAGELADDAQDSYSRRTLLLARAPWLAWLGRGREAMALLERAEPLCATGVRPRALLAVARAQVARVREGWDACLAHLDAAAAILAGERDPALRAEVLGLRLLAARSRGDASTEARAAASLRALAAESGLRAARQWLDAWAGASAPAGSSGVLPPVLEVVSSRSPALALTRGMLGLIPETLGVVPGRRLHLFADALVVESTGDVTRRPGLSARATALLRALARAEGARGGLFTAVWGLKTYDPARHAGPLKTAISRLRAALGDAQGWVRSTPDGYALDPAVTVCVHDGATEPGARAALRPADLARNDRQRRLLASLGGREMSVAALARAVGEPQRTVSRELAAMCAAGLLRRQGAGRATTYQRGG